MASGKPLPGRLLVTVGCMMKHYSCMHRGSSRNGSYLLPRFDTVAAPRQKHETVGRETRTGAGGFKRREAGTKRFVCLLPLTVLSFSASGIWHLASFLDLT